LSSVNPMIYLKDYPLLIFLVSLVILSISINLGSKTLKKIFQPTAEIRDDLSIILGGTLTLLGLIIGFTFSMAISRYDTRKLLEEEEANAIGTEYVRAGLLPAADAAKVRFLLRTYYDQRILFYTTRDAAEVNKINEHTSEIQTELWNAVETPANNDRSAPMALVASGMNDVLNSRGYTQAAWWNRIPSPAWVLLLIIAIASHMLMGYRARNLKTEKMLLMILPLLVSLSFFLIADIDSPRGGVIRVVPENLNNISEEIR